MDLVRIIYNGDFGGGLDWLHVPCLTAGGGMGMVAGGYLPNIGSVYIFIICADEIIWLLLP